MNGITQYSGTSFPFGKQESIRFIERTCPGKDSRILDVGPGRGIYNKLLKEKGYWDIDAVEVYTPYVEAFNLRTMYRNVFNRNVVGFEYDHYNIVIMGDVVEHLHVEPAQGVVGYARQHCDLVLIAVPYLSVQVGSQLDGSGDHRQPDLTRSVFLNRYPGFSLLIDNSQLGVFYSLRSGQ